jgi:hypothetical protein
MAFTGRQQATVRVGLPAGITDHRGGLEAEYPGQRHDRVLQRPALLLVKKAVTGLEKELPLLQSRHRQVDAEVDELGAQRETVGLHTVGKGCQRVQHQARVLW